MSAKGQQIALVGSPLGGHYAGSFQYVAGGGDHGWTDFGSDVASVLRFAGCGG